jgi:hypothetical protein
MIGNQYWSTQNGRSMSGISYPGPYNTWWGMQGNTYASVGPFAPPGLTPAQFWNYMVNTSLKGGWSVK